MNASADLTLCCIVVHQWERRLSVFEKGYITSGFSTAVRMNITYRCDHSFEYERKKTLLFNCACTCDGGSKLTLATVLLCCQRHPAKTVATWYSMPDTDGGGSSCLSLPVSVSVLICFPSESPNFYRTFMGLLAHTCAARPSMMNNRLNVPSRFFCQEQLGDEMRRRVSEESRTKETVVPLLQKPLQKRAQKTWGGKIKTIEKKENN